MCGACFEVCPVRIDIPSVLVELRSQVVDAHRGGLPKPEAIAFKGAAATFSKSTRLGFAERFTRVGMRVGKRFAPWSGARDLPAAPSESFRSWWKRTDGGSHD